MNILHVFRSPVGGLFRHVLDLARGQIARGHRVGMLVSNRTGGARADAALAELSPQLALGLTRVSMSRQLMPSDARGILHLSRRIAATKADIVHGHGAKGGAYARLAPARRGIVRTYTPHGGSLLFGHETMSGKVYLGIERFLMPRGGLYLFESRYSANMFNAKIGDPTRKAIARVVPNGVSPPEFEPIQFAPDASDVIFLGELRHLKGIDVLIDALLKLRAGGRDVSATIVGDGPDAAEIRARAKPLGAAVQFRSPMPGREAQALGRVMVVASRQESFPYVVLEAAAAGRPLIATNVGGIPEIYGPYAARLIPADNPDVMATALASKLDRPDEAGKEARELQQRVRECFSTDVMVEGILAAYDEALRR